MARPLVAAGTVGEGGSGGDGGWVSRDSGDGGGGGSGIVAAWESGGMVAGHLVAVIKVVVATARWQEKAARTHKLRARWREKAERAVAMSWPVGIWKTGEESS